MGRFVGAGLALVVVLSAVTAWSVVQALAGWRLVVVAVAVCSVVLARWALRRGGRRRSRHPWATSTR